MNLFEIYGLIGTLATFGFVTAYILVSAAAPLYLRSLGRLTPQAIVYFCFGRFSPCVRRSSATFIRFLMRRIRIYPTSMQLYS